MHERLTTPCAGRVEKSERRHGAVQENGRARRDSKESVAQPLRPVTRLPPSGIITSSTPLTVNFFGHFSLNP